MRRYLLLLLAAFLAAGAVLLPGRLSQWGDRVLLDEPHIIQEEEREGFAESIQLTVGEKLMLMRTGELDRLSLSGEQSGMLYAGRSGGEGANVEFFYAQAESAPQEEPDAALRLVDGQWSRRFGEARGEVRALQAMGALPQLWGVEDEIAFEDCEQVLYIDRSTLLSFQVYSLTLACGPYALDVSVDAQSGRVLSFHLAWEKSEELNWGMRGAASFGTAWRDYWGLDSVSGNWYNSYNRSVLEDAVKLVGKNGDYNSNGQIPFTYNGQTMNIPLVNWASGSRGYALLWNK